MMPVRFTWDGEAMVPAKSCQRLCDRQFVVGETYPLVVDEPRSQMSHNHFFAAVHEAWQNLPESQSSRFRTPEHLRKWALIKASFCTERTIVAASDEQAQQIAALADALDEFAVVMVSGCIVRVYTAESQSRRAMGSKKFQKSKQAVLDVISAMIGVSTDDLQRRDMRAA
jgi:hypothetical protein